MIYSIGREIDDCTTNEWLGKTFRATACGTKGSTASKERHRNMGQAGVEQGADSRPSSLSHPSQQDFSAFACVPADTVQETPDLPAVYPVDRP